MESGFVLIAMRRAQNGANLHQNTGAYHYRDYNHAFK